MPGLVSLHYALSVVLRCLIPYSVSLIYERERMAEVTEHVPPLELGVLQESHVHFMGLLKSKHAAAQYWW